jgi:hypothetical protein
MAQQQQFPQQQQQQQQQQLVVPQLYYSIDVECVATGADHNSRAVAQIALVDQYEQVSLASHRPQRAAGSTTPHPVTALRPAMLDPSQQHRLCSSNGWPAQAAANSSAGAWPPRCALPCPAPPRALVSCRQVVLNLYVKPEAAVVSYLTDLTGITRDLVERFGRPLAEQVRRGRPHAHAPPCACTDSWSAEPRCPGSRRQG